MHPGSNFRVTKLTIYQPLAIGLFSCQESHSGIKVQCQEVTEVKEVVDKESRHDVIGRHQICRVLHASAASSDDLHDLQ